MDGAADPISKRRDGMRIKLGDIGRTGIGSNYLAASKSDGDGSAERNRIQLQARRWVNGSRDEDRSGSYEVQDWMIARILDAHTDDHNGAMGMYHSLDRMKRIVAKIESAKITSDAKWAAFKAQHPASRPAFQPEA
jgi:hypothetical protein